MIIIQKDSWRAECIAAIGLDAVGVMDGNGLVKVFPVNCDDYIGYRYETIEEATVAHQNILDAWKLEIQGIYRKRLSD